MVFVFICHLSIVPPLMNYSFIILLYIAACCVCFDTCKKQKPCFYVSLVERSLCKQTSPKAAYCTTVKMSNNHVLYYMFSGLVFFSSKEYFCLLASMIWRDDCLNKGKFAYKIRWMWFKWELLKATSHEVIHHWQQDKYLVLRRKVPITCSAIQRLGSNQLMRRCFYNLESYQVQEIPQLWI